MVKTTKKSSYEKIKKVYKGSEIEKTLNELEHGININGNNINTVKEEVKKAQKIVKLMIEINHEMVFLKETIKFKANTRIYEISYQSIRYHSTKGEGYYRRPKDFNSIQKFLLKGNKKVKIIN